MQLAVDIVYGTTLVVPQEYVGAMTEILVHSQVTRKKYHPVTSQIVYEKDDTTEGVPTIILLHDNEIVDKNALTEETPE